MKVEKTVVLSSISARKKVGDELKLERAHWRMHHGGRQALDGGVVGGIRMVAKFLEGGDVVLASEKQNYVDGPWVGQGHGVTLTGDEAGELWEAIGEW